jgi:hypothetical protein
MDADRLQRSHGGQTVTELAIVTWFWGGKYPTEDVRKLARGVARHLSAPHRFVVATDQPKLFPFGSEEILTTPIDDIELTRIPGCFARLAMFNPAWQSSGVFAGARRFVCMDLDTVITGPLDPLFQGGEPFQILQGANSTNPCPYNGSLWTVNKYYRPDVYRDFSMEAAARVPHWQFPDDQAWFAHHLPDAAGWRSGTRGVYAFQKPGWPSGEALPADARIVVFPGWRSPEKFKRLQWVRDNWR